jgi:tRNA 2-thiouridine synthesizing protein A
VVFPYAAPQRKPAICDKIPFPPIIFEDIPMEFTREVDARGLHCPLPILRAKKALAEMSTGEVLRVVATDPGSVRDFQAFSKQTGNALLEHSATDEEFVFFMRRK